MTDSYARISRVVFNSLARLNEERSGAEQIPVSEATALVGSASPLDSLAFVLLVTSVEEGIAEEFGQEITLVTPDFVDDHEHLRTVNTLIAFIASRLVVQ